MHSSNLFSLDLEDSLTSTNTNFLDFSSETTLETEHTHCTFKSPLGL